MPEDIRESRWVDSRLMGRPAASEEDLIPLMPGTPHSANGATIQGLAGQGSSSSLLRHASTRHRVEPRISHGRGGVGNIRKIAAVKLSAYRH